ncbi:MAG: 2-succinyl-5-enolpyruvyl-6-hydroxy-3-cyclohexene-1-carboxylic-acid synthase [Anaerolineales bacterium]|nr:2-succinyl-5-enolpyruvyl-6-hydroxy-3-cyclohexene-1-carboxylic-acid synthase [Anaerolineales bacterium]
MLPSQAAYLYIGALVDELARAGVQHVCIAPGSRSTPLALTFAEQKNIQLWMHYDERSAAFFALGLAKATRQPVALVCTSGTAAANFFPAIIEAHYARVPLLVLTADRPPELRDAGAPQTIDQIKIYGHYAKWFVELSLPEGTPETLRYARTVASRAVAEAATAPAGVVHLNFPLREPLVPVPTQVDFETARPAGQPYAVVSSGVRVPEPASIEKLAHELAQIERGLIIAGPQTNPAFPAAITQLAEQLGFPVLADPLSQVRCGPHSRANVLDSYDAFLRDEKIAQQLAPEVVLRFGPMPTSKPVLQYLQRHAHARQVLIDDGEWQDPARLASDVFVCEPTAFIQTLRVCAKPTLRVSEWLNNWRTIAQQTRATITAQINSYAEWFEGRVFSELAACLPAGATLFASSSMPVRDLDTFFTGSERHLRFLANRGANGIDGVISSALGASVTGPLVLVIGDIAFYHDMNGLLAAKLHGLNAVIVLINNDGGGIFSFLPQAAHPQHFEQLFGTPHGLDFAPAAELYGATLTRPNNWPEFQHAVTHGLAAGGLHLVEIRTHRETNVTMHREVWKVVSMKLHESP